MDPDSIPPPAGTRFTVDLDSDEEASNPPPLLSNILIGDISERSVSSTALPPTFDASKSSGGFPAHTKRKRPSAFRQQRNAASGAAASNKGGPYKPTPLPTNLGGGSYVGGLNQGGATDEMASIRVENERRLAAMSSQEMEQERQELMSSLSPELLQMFLKRASLDDVMETSRPVKLAEEPKTSDPQPTSDPAASEGGQPPQTNETPRPLHLENIPESAFPPAVKIHFPQPPSSSEDPDLDPSSPEFLQHLHEKYFPNLPADPQKLAWMMPPSDSDPDPLYSPTLSSILPSAVRFDFKGRLLPPRKSREVPSNLGLHHHADSPLSAGYTIPELAHLARSSFPAQRCMAFQTLGRVLFRLGTGKYSKTADGEETNGGTDLDRGLWRCIHEGRVIESLQEAATGGKNGQGSSHLGVKNYALEALWLWQKGGGERWRAE
ncbi:hypothetical protein ABW19_dt0201752 [Dactylella cylindrospora]|nr:hypothetical protein ABW19_dt0201752 [Dactylella cylindrospora]